MPAGDSPAILCARFLEANNYHDTLRAFLAEAGLPPDAGSTNVGDLTIEKVLEEKKMFDLSLAFERSNIPSGGREWSMPAPTKAVAVCSLPSSANLLHVSLEEVKEEPGGKICQVLFASTADRRLHLLDARKGFTLLKSLNDIHDSPILSCTVLASEGMLTVTTSMSGQVVLYDHRANRVLDERRDHQKYVVRAARWKDGEAFWVATAGWDAMIFLYRIRGDVPSGACRLGEPVVSLHLATNPDTITFITPPAYAQPLLLVTRRDSASLHYYCWEVVDATTSRAVTLRLLGSQNLAPHSNAWISFCPSSVAICPTNPQLLAVATSSVPHMKLIIVQLLLPPLPSSHTEASGNVERATQADLSSQKLAVAEQENAAILLQVSTFAPQTPYSTPQVCWRPDGSGVWVNGDDGVLRGLDATNGKIMSTLKGGHEPGSKIRSIWAGMLNASGEKEGEEWVVTGGFDKKLIAWKLTAEETI
ncbi:MAG: hypothetical protein LQ343_006705 [Gyalolechia ehrenbergii]|nr:MAG: hypothetical protein LQ343_006705 [Gyalolechia ehrenbergii]